ncbi:MAG: hypothetical protein AAF085_06075 [Planctomycetota bacterium]
MTDQTKRLVTYLSFAVLFLLVGALTLGPMTRSATALPANATPLSQQGFQAGDAEGGEELSPAEQRRKAAEERRKLLEERDAKFRVEAEAVYAKYEDAYMSGRMDEVQELYREVRTKQRFLPREKQQAIRHMYQKAPEYRPRWWKGTKKQEKNSFKAEIWGRDFFANYVPTRELGLQAVYPEYGVNPGTGEIEVVDLIILVTWKPLMVDSTEPAKGKLAKMHDYKLGDIAEVIVWHELGHNYLTDALSTKNNLELYDRYSDLYSTMHEYFADMAAVYHGKPQARKMALQFRLDELDYYTNDSSHCRGAHGIGAIFITDVMMNPDKWPSIRFPPSVPKQQVELNTIIYAYENLPAKLTAEEDIRLQGLAEEFVMKQGEKTFKSKGEIPLQNRLKFNLMVGEDRENQPKRDAWVTTKLEGLISEGRADKLAAGETYEPPKRDKERRRTEFPNFKIVNGEIVKEQQEDGPPRIEVPWDF